MKPGFYIVSTPIGNLYDITLRALDTLKCSHLILCENTLISRKLLTKYNIKVKTKPYKDYSTSKEHDYILDSLKHGLIISLITDAGTPVISDPGYKIIQMVIDNGYFLDVVPGVSSPIAALTVSGLEPNRFLFTGFLPKNVKARKEIFNKFSNIQATMIFLESPNRLLRSLIDAYEIFGNRKACIARELTKFYQEIKRENLVNLIEFYKENTIKGEIVLLISGKSNSLNTKNKLDKEELNTFLNLYFSKTYSVKIATDIANKIFKNFYTKKEIYNIAKNIKENIKLKANK